MKTTGVMVLAVLLGACASTQQLQQYPGNRLSGQDATLYVVRKNSIWGGALAAPIYVHKYLLGRIGPGGRLETKIPLGPVSVSSTTSDIIFHARPGEEYFVEVSMPAQIWWFTPDFELRQIGHEEASSIVHKE